MPTDTVASQSWEVAYIVGLCDKNGWIKPTAYQGIYNAVHRNVEPELFPCLRALGPSTPALRFPLSLTQPAPRSLILRVQPPWRRILHASVYEGCKGGGGLPLRPEQGPGIILPRTVLESAAASSAPHTCRDCLPFHALRQDEYFEALEMVKPVADAHKLTLAEVALRWVSHHSLMSREHGDNVLIGASSNAHLEANLLDLEKGPLPEDVVKALDLAWEHVRPVASKVRLGSCFSSRTLADWPDLRQYWH